MSEPAKSKEASPATSEPSSESSSGPSSAAVQVGHDPLASRVLAGERAALAEALNLIEDRRPSSQRRARGLLGALRGKGEARRIGITGPPGVGKSTLAGALAAALRRKGHRVAIVAVDPSSPTSGGAILGDRARIDYDPSDEGIFIRSIATAGKLGGLAWAAPAAVSLLAATFDFVLLETTGVGQTEVDVRHVVDTVVLVIQPGSGDTLQFLKAGIMEIPDLVVVNKGDLGPLASRAASDLAHAQAAPVLTTSALHGQGVDAFCDTLLSRAIDPSRIDEGQRAWLMSLFVDEHGDHGVRALGGRVALRARIDELLVGETADVVGALSADYLEHCKTIGNEHERT